MQKIVVWGAGKVGENMVSLLGTDKIDYIVDSKEDMKEFMDIRVVSPQWLWDNASKDSLILITPQKHEDAIAKQCREKGLEYSYTVSETYELMCCIIRQIPDSFWRNLLSEKCQILLNGTNRLIETIIRYRLLEFGVDADVISVTSWAEVKDVQNCVCLSFLRNEDEQNNSNPEKIKTIDLYKLMHDKELYYNSKLERFRNCHNGKRCFIVATGPSLRMEDLEILQKNNEICISVNGIVRAFDKTEWRPTYFVASDANFARNHREIIDRMNCEAKFIADRAWCFDSEEAIENNIYEWHLDFKWSEDEPPAFSDDFARASYRGKTVVYEGALQLAAFMGFDEIYLLGTDCTRENTAGSTPHFYEAKPGDAVSTVFEHVDQYFIAYQVAKEFADSHGFKIYNATRGGNLEVFERVDFDSLFE